MGNQDIDGLRQAILHDALEMARVEVQQAEEFSSAEQERARREAEVERVRILRAAERDAKSLLRRVASTAELESRRQLREARERLVRQVLDQALMRLKQETSIEARRGVLLRLVVEAAREIGGGRLVLRTARADTGLLSLELLAEARELLAQEGISAELRVVEEPAEIQGGVIVGRDDGHLVADNSFEARLRRQEANLRGNIWRILSGEG